MEKRARAAPETKTAPGLGAEGAAQQGLKGREPRHVSSSALAQQWSTIASAPSNARIIGLVIDREHVGDVERVIRICQSAEACALLAMWRGRQERFPFVVLAGQLHRQAGGIVGGMAADWQHALDLYRFVWRRLDSLAAQKGDLTSMWILHVTPERQAIIQGLTAAEQTVAGSA